MKNTILILLFICFGASCSKSETSSTTETPVVSEMMEEEPNNSENEGGEEEEEDADAIQGEFMDGAHPTSGTATVNGDRTTLILKDFKSDGGPILELYVATGVDAAEYETLGELQGLEGDFTYVLPEGIDFETHNYVLVWCVDFSVSFGHAILE